MAHFRWGAVGGRPLCFRGCGGLILLFSLFLFVFFLGENLRPFRWVLCFFSLLEQFFCEGGLFL